MLSSWSHYFSATVNAEVAARVQQLADTFAATCMAQRHFVVQRMEGNDILAADPRMLAFEFIFSIMLRKSQVRLVRLFADSVARNESKCHQMIMSSGPLHRQDDAQFAEGTTLAAADADLYHLLAVAAAFFYR